MAHATDRAVLTGGNQQKVALARLFGQNASVLILDEPTRGVDVGAKVEIYRLIRQQAETGKAVVVISSYLPELFGLCDQLAVMHAGTLSEVRPVDKWSEESVMQFATSGTTDLIS
ncbi:MAG: ATP-binding cassette domain-containing protein [bacterium]